MWFRRSGIVRKSACLICDFRIGLPSPFRHDFQENLATLMDEVKVRGLRERRVFRIEVGPDTSRLPITNPPQCPDGRRLKRRSHCMAVMNNRHNSLRPRSGPKNEAAEYEAVGPVNQDVAGDPLRMDRNG